MPLALAQRKEHAMTDEMVAIFQHASWLAERGEYASSAAEYEKFLSQVETSSSTWSQKDRDFAVRSASFNLAQVYNHLGRFKEALNQVTTGLSCSPSLTGLAIAAAARGEALCALDHVELGERAFAQAVAAHPITGRLNAADSMTRVTSKDMLDTAAQLLSEVEEIWKQEAAQSSSGPGSNRQTPELYTIRGKIFARRGQTAQAKEWFDKALKVDSSYEDAKLQLRNLP